MSDGTTLEEQRRQAGRRRIIRHLRLGGMLCPFTCDDGYRCQLPESHADFHTREFFESGEVLAFPATPGDTDGVAR